MKTKGRMVVKKPFVISFIIMLVSCSVWLSGCETNANSIHVTVRAWAYTYYPAVAETQERFDISESNAENFTLYREFTYNNNSQSWTSDEAIIGYDMTPDQTITITVYNPQSNPMSQTRVVTYNEIVNVQGHNNSKNYDLPEAFRV